MSQENKQLIDDLKVTPIQMPSDSYFEGLKKNLLDQIGNTRLEEKKEPRIIPMYKRWYVWGSAAAILLFVFLVSRNDPNSAPGASESLKISLSAVSNEEIYEYLDQHIEDLDAETIVSHIDAGSFTGTEEQTDQTQVKQQAPSSQSPLLDEINDEEILDYLKNDPGSQDGELDEYLLIEI